MAVNDHTLNQAQRTAYYERVERPVRGDGNRRVSVLLPYSKLVIDGVEYLESNSVNPNAVLDAEGGGAHAVPSHGTVVEDQFVSRSLGVRSGDIPQGTIRSEPADVKLHGMGWI